MNSILLLAEHFRGEISEITFELLTVGRKIADSLNFPLHALLIGKNVASLTPQLKMADTVLVLENSGYEMPSTDDVTTVLTEIMDKKKASIVLVGGTNIAAGIGSKLAIRTKFPLVNFCQNLRIENGLIVVTSQLFGGKILADVKLAENRGILCIYPGSFSPEAGKDRPVPAVEKVDQPAAGSKLTFLNYLEPEKGDVDITRQDFLIAIGRGIENADNIPMAEELAQVLGGAVCASRPVVDQGWMPLSRQVGKSGMTVKPKLYITLGISGAPEHVEGMKNSGLVISINKDPNAPIFGVSHFGVCADLLDIIPPLLEKIKARKG